MPLRRLWRWRARGKYPLLHALFEHLESFRNHRATGKELAVLGITDIIGVEIGISPLENVLSRNLGELILQARKSPAAVRLASCLAPHSKLNEKS